MDHKNRNTKSVYQVLVDGEIVKEYQKLKEARQYLRTLTRLSDGSVVEIRRITTTTTIETLTKLTATTTTTLVSTETLFDDFANFDN